MPIISDRVVMTESAYMVIAGAALIRGAKAQKLTSLGIGGADVHVHTSGCADERVPDDPTAIALIREEVSKLPASAAEFYRHGRDAAPPKHSAEELCALFPSDPRHGYDVEEVVARLVDSSLFHEVLPHCGREVYTGVGRIGGLWVGLIGNRQGVFDEPGQGKRLGGVLYREGIAKLTTFVRTCADDGVPVIWLQDISGFDIGVEAEMQGLLGYGSNLIYANSTHTAPVFTVLLRKASGAGYYAMSGMPYEPLLQLATPLTRLAVMEGRTLAIAAFNSKLDDDFKIATEDPKERAEIEAGMDEVANRIEQDMSPVRAASRMDVDEVVPLGTLRSWLECLVEMSWQSTGYRRTKNPRIWSLHDLNVLLDTPRPPQGRERMTLEGEQLRMPISGRWEPTLLAGQGLVADCLLGYVQQGRKRMELRAPPSVKGWVVARCAEEGVLGVGDVAVDLRAAVHGESDEDVLPSSVITGDVPAGVTVVCAETEGVVYLSPKPGAPPFVNVDQRVEARTTLALVEVMKTFGSVRAPHAGEVSRVLVNDGDAVSSGDALIWLRTEDDSC
jgi:biotin carboxyl carrier protein